MQVVCGRGEYRYWVSILSIDTEYRVWGCGSMPTPMLYFWLIVKYIWYLKECKYILHVTARMAGRNANIYYMSTVSRHGALGVGSVEPCNKYYMLLTCFLHLRRTNVHKNLSLFCLRTHHRAYVVV